MGSGLVFYLVHLVGGYGLLSWLGAVACVLTIAVLLYRGSALTAAFAIIAVPLVAYRTAPRAEMFTILIFTLFLQILWGHLHLRTSALWALPLLMVLWVNLHPGFVLGLVLTAIYPACELLRFFKDESRAEVMMRIRTTCPWLLAVWLVTLLNPWGANLYSALARQHQATALHSQWINEWSAVTVNWNTVRQGVTLRDPDSAAFALLVAAALGTVVACLRRQWSAALLLIGALAAVVQHMRFLGLFACTVTIVAAPILSGELTAVWERVRYPTIRKAVLACAVLALLALAAVRSWDLVSNRYYFSSNNISSFGPGLSWWYPEQAVRFIMRESIPPRLFNTYNEGGFLVWALGLRYLDYVDGRALPFGPDMFVRMSRLMQASPDSPAWIDEADKYDINAILIPLGRYEGLKFVGDALAQFCNSSSWRPVYLDEVSVVFVRARPETQQIIDRNQVDCRTAPVPRVVVGGSRSVAFNQWANASAVLFVLGRNQESVAAASSALSLFSKSAATYFVRAKARKNLGDLAGAQNDLRMAAHLEDGIATWSELADLYYQTGQFGAALSAGEHVATLSADPLPIYLWLGSAYLQAKQPSMALSSFDRADRVLAGRDRQEVRLPLADLSEGRSRAWNEMGNLREATAQQERAVSCAPERATAWLRLAELYEQQGRVAEAQKARARAGRNEVPIN